MQPHHSMHDLHDCYKFSYNYSDAPMKCTLVLQLVIMFLVHRPHQFLQNAELQKYNNARAQISRE